MSEIVLATDLGGTNLRMAAVDRRGNVVCRKKKPTPRGEDGSAILELMSETARELIDLCLDYSPVAIAAAVPGTIDFENGVITRAPNLPELDGFSMVARLEKELGFAAVLENDANAAAVGEHWLGASRSVENSIMVTLGTGVGGGLFVEGELIRGKDGTAGEIGHINVEPDGHPCGCGSYGCVEQYSSASAVVRMAGELAEGVPDSRLAENGDLTSRDVFDIAIAGDPLAIEVFRLQGYYLGLMLAGLVNTLNPETIVIGGGASAAWELFSPHTINEIRRRSYARPAERAKIVRAELGDDAGILGGVRLGLSKANQAIGTLDTGI